jgi:hypothetical protein
MSMGDFETKRVWISCCAMDYNWLFASAGDEWGVVAPSKIDISRIRYYLQWVFYLELQFLNLKLREDRARLFHSMHLWLWDQFTDGRAAPCEDLFTLLEGIASSLEAEATQSRKANKALWGGSSVSAVSAWVTNRSQFRLPTRLHENLYWITEMLLPAFAEGVFARRSIANLPTDKLKRGGTQLRFHTNQKNFFSVCSNGLGDRTLLPLLQ